MHFRAAFNEAVLPWVEQGGSDRSIWIWLHSYLKQNIQFFSNVYISISVIAARLVSDYFHGGNAKGKDSLIEKELGFEIKQIIVGAIKVFAIPFLDVILKNRTALKQVPGIGNISPIVQGKIVQFASELGGKLLEAGDGAAADATIGEVSDKLIRKIESSTK